MIIQEFVRKKFNEHMPQANILILERNSIDIYDSKDSEIIIERSSNIQFQLLEILEIVEIEPSTHLKVKLPNGKKGYLKPIDSFIILPKKIKQVRISKDVIFNNPLNEFIGMDKTNFENNKHRVMFSSQYAIFNNEIFECLTYVDEIIAFVRPSEVNIMQRYERPFTILENTTIYRDSIMTKPVKTLQKGNKSFNSQYVILEEEKLRFKDNGKSYWLNLSDTNLIVEKEHHIYDSLDELILDSILYQYSLKLENYHKYYQKILTKEIKK